MSQPPTALPPDVDALEDVWTQLGSTPRAITFDSLQPLLVHADGATTTPDSIDKFLDSFALYTRLDAVDEQGRPFVPFVRPMSQRQFELVQYGVLLNPAEKTLLVGHKFREPLANFAQDAGMLPPTDDSVPVSPSSGVAPVSENHDVYLLRLMTVEVPAPAPAATTGATDGTEEGAGDATAPTVRRICAVPQFRLVFRNAGSSDSAAAARYVLSGVFVSAHRFWDLHDDTRERTSNAPSLDYYERLHENNSTTVQQRIEAWRAWTRLTGASVLSDPLAGIDRPGDAVAIASNKKPARDQTCGYKVPGQGELEEVDEAIDAAAPPSSQVDCGEDFIPRRCRYPTDRMATRVIVAERSKAIGARAQWAQWCAELGLYNRDEREDVPTEAVRVLFKDTRHGTNSIEDGELCAFLPADAQCDLKTVYGTFSEEQLRLWVANALATAEAARVKQLMLRLDVPLLRSRCCGLLSLKSSRGDHVSALDAATEHVLRIVIETVEDFVQGSGVLWRVIVLTEPPFDADTHDSNHVSELQLAEETLRRIQKEKGYAEGATPIAPSPTRGCSRQRKVRALEVDSVATLSPARRGKGAKAGMSEIAEAASPPREIVFNERNLVSAAITGVPISDAQLRALFNRLDVKKDGVLTQDELSRIFLRHTDLYNDVTLTDRGTIAPRKTQEGFLSSGNVLSPLDDCGVPQNEATVRAFVAKHCAASKNKMTYPEFCVMMLELARR